ncbi:MAG: hypothetical protein E6L04_03170, partial [Thaumarchaeota archaeon]
MSIIGGQTGDKCLMKIPKLKALNIDLKLFAVLLSLTLILSSLSILNFHSVYSQGSEDAKSLNCKDNTDQSQYVSNVQLQNKSDGLGPVTNDLPGFHYVKKFD